MSFCNLSFSECLQYVLEQQIEFVDRNLVLALTCPENNNWKSYAEEAVRELRNERRKRIERFDTHFKPNLPADIFDSLTRPSLFVIFGARTFSTQETEDNILNSVGIHADYVNGKTTFEEAAEAVEKKRIERAENPETNQVKRALVSVSLHMSLARKHKDCIDFIKSSASVDGGATEGMLDLLISKLQNGQRECHQNLKQSFAQAGVNEDEVGMASSRNYFVDRDEYYYDDHEDGLDKKSFPDIDTIRLVQYEYVDLGKGKPDDVVRLAIMYHRTNRLEGAIENHFQDHGCYDAYDWMRRSNKCKLFVSKIEAGLPSDKEIVDFVTTFSKKPDVKRRGGRGRRNLDCSDYDDNFACGNDPDTDATWDAYWGT